MRERTILIREDEGIEQGDDARSFDDFFLSSFAYEQKKQIKLKKRGGEKIIKNHEDWAV